MNLDLLILFGYFGMILFIALIFRKKGKRSVAEYFISNRSLKWHSIAISTIATNIHAGHFLGMAGSAYLYGLAQANLEINAVLGILIAAFFFIPLYLRHNVITITQFFEKKFGSRVALTYSILTMLLYGTLYLGSTLFWGAYAINILFDSQISFLGSAGPIRICILIFILGGFSAFYTSLGGLSAVVRTDIVQFILLLGGGFLILFLAIHKLGGWDKSGQHVSRIFFQKTE